MPHIPASVAESNLYAVVQDAGLQRTHQGKVRNTYRINRSKLLVEATDRISIFDFVLPALVREKGEILTAMTSFWLDMVLVEVQNHCLGFGHSIDTHLPAQLHLKPELQARSLVVETLEMTEFEWIVRQYLTGSGLKDYNRDGHICGNHLPPGLHDGSNLNVCIFTPSTKETEGHDRNIDYRIVVAKHGEENVNQCLGIFSRMRDYAAEKGILLADSKMEFGRQRGTSKRLLTLGDEFGTPDCSRFYKKTEWQVSTLQRKAPPSYDKQFVRQWGETITLNGVSLKDLDPKNPEHITFVDNLQVPTEVLERTTEIYHEIFECITGYSLRAYQRECMHIAA